MKIKPYNEQYFDQLCTVMDKARMQELKSENLEQVFMSLRDAPYLDYLLSCRIYIALENDNLMGFVGFKPGRLEFIYVDPAKQGKGVATELMKKALAELMQPVKLDVFTNNRQAKSLYKKFGFKTTKTITENWSEEYPVIFSQDTMELK